MRTLWTWFLLVWCKGVFVSLLAHYPRHGEMDEMDDRVKFVENGVGE